MPSREMYNVRRGKKQSRKRHEKEAGPKGPLFTTALGLNIRDGSVPSLPTSGITPDPITSPRTRLNWAPSLSKPTSPASSLWQPIRSFALSQLTSLVRRATLRECDLAPKYEKVHNFKVRRYFVSPILFVWVCVYVCVFNDAGVADSAHTDLFKFTLENTWLEVILAITHFRTCVHTGLRINPLSPLDIKHISILQGARSEEHKGQSHSAHRHTQRAMWCGEMISIWIYRVKLWHKWAD